MPHALHDVARRLQCAGKGTLLPPWLPPPLHPFARCKVNCLGGGTPLPPQLILQGVESPFPAYSADISSPAPFAPGDNPGIWASRPHPCQPHPRVCLLLGCLSRLPWAPQPSLPSLREPLGLSRPAGQFHSPPPPTSQQSGPIQQQHLGGGVGKGVLKSYLSSTEQSWFHSEGQGLGALSVVPVQR